MLLSRAVPVGFNPMRVKTLSFNLNGTAIPKCRSLASRFVFKSTPSQSRCGYSSSSKHRELDEKFKASSDERKPKPTPSFSQDFVPFEEGQKIVHDVTEQEWNPSKVESAYDPSEYFSLSRGKTGVFELEELVQLLEEERAFDTCVISIPKEKMYADYLVLATARSQKHLKAVATFIRHVFKRKHLKPTDVIPALEGGKATKDWAALDLGNIALHILTAEKREKMDLETLWTVGPQFDDLTNQKDPEIVRLLGEFATAYEQKNESRN